MNPKTIVIGAGIAGASVAFQLSRHHDVTLIEAEEPGSGASGVAGGLFSPMIALRGRPVWHIDQAIEKFNRMLDRSGTTDLFDNRGVVRPAKDVQQAEFFKQSVEMAPDHAEWLTRDQLAERFPKIKAPLGALFAKTGGAFSTTEFCKKITEAAVKNGCRLITQKMAINWGEEKRKAFVDVMGDITDPINSVERLQADYLVLAFGRTFFEHPALQNLDLHAVKGQTLRIKRPESLTFEDLPPTSGLAYIIPEEETLAIGSSFDHKFRNLDASDEISQVLLDKARAIVPEIDEEAEILEQHVGVRVTVPRIRLPMVGAIPGHKRIWMFTAFGSKGLLLAPYLASQLRFWFNKPADIPEDLTVRVKTS